MYTDSYTKPSPCPRRSKKSLCVVPGGVVAVKGGFRPFRRPLVTEQWIWLF